MLSSAFRWRLLDVCVEYLRSQRWLLAAVVATAVEVWPLSPWLRVEFLVEEVGWQRWFSIM
jgi:hypothetical protein